MLGIETSCDETSAAIVRGTVGAPVMESLVILSQDVHRLFGGVVPEIASRQHLTGIVPTVAAALRDAGVTVTLNSDDPGMFATSLCGEYQLVHDVFDVDQRGLVELARTAVRSSFRSGVGKRELLAEIDSYEAGHAARTTPAHRST